MSEPVRTFNSAIEVLEAKAAQCRHFQRQSEQQAVARRGDMEKCEADAAMWAKEAEAIEAAIRLLDGAFDPPVDKA